MNARSMFAALLALVALVLAACAGTAGPSDATSEDAPVLTASAAPTPAQGVPQKVEVTFYAAADNDPPGSAEIAHPNSRHPVAGGTGTAADPLSLATDPRELRPGVLVYYPPVRKYFVMEDDCAPCIDEWSASRKPHVDLWMANTTDPAVRDCESALTPDDPDTIIVNPPTDLPVDPRPLFADGRCWPNT